MYIFAWNANSEGAKLLKDALRIQRIRNEGSRFKGSANRTVINWGSSELPPEIMKCRVLNTPDQVHSCSNKLTFFRNISREYREILPPWTTDFNTAADWVGSGEVVCARTILTGHSAAGLVLMEKNAPATLVRAPLYTKYVKKIEEYRVHVISGEIVTVQKKVLKREKAESGEPINWKVRNLDNGFIYQRENINPAEIVLRVAREAMGASGLTFGAVDVIYTKAGHAYVLEINTAPGITGTTVEEYAAAFRRYM